jgi:collagen type I/II/III/V/XI/XXIV/XXVII alpha
MLARSPVSDHNDAGASAVHGHDQHHHHHHHHHHHQPPIECDKTPCFAKGTLIATPRRDVPVESLQVGDRVLTLLDHRSDTVTWIGHRAIDIRRHPAPDLVRPIRIAAGAFDNGCPSRDLLLSPDHAIFVEGVLIPVKYLIDHHSITPVAQDQVVYYHIELTRHSVVLAEGLPAESYLDIGDRSNFGNGGRWVQLFPDFSTRRPDTSLIWEAQGCAELVVCGPHVAAARRKVAARALQTGLGQGASIGQQQGVARSKGRRFIR